MASVLEYSSANKPVPRLNQYSNIHHCKKCPYITTSLILVRNHVARHKATLQPFTCFKSEPEIFYCRDCDFKTFYTRGFIEHIRSHTDKEESQDGQCNLPTTDTSKPQEVSCDVESEQMEVLQESTNLNCTERPKSHVQNRRSDEGIEWYHCDLCPRKFRWKAILKRHVENVHECENPFICYSCSTCFTTNEDLRQHVLEKHNTEEEVHLESHLETEDIKWYDCTKCKYRSRSECLLKTHVTRNHSQLTDDGDQCSFKVVRMFNVSEDTPKKKPFRCRYCGFKSPDRQNLKTHILLSHTPSKDITTWFPCNKCSSKFRLKKLLDKHFFLVHAHEGLHCTECAYTCDSRNKLDEHIMSKHRAVEDTKWFHCVECRYCSRSVYMLKRHVRKKHIGLTDWLDETRSFQCDKCSFQTDRMSQLRKHLNLSNHTLEKSGWFDCVKCEYKCRSEPLLKKHVTMNHTELTDETQWFQCDECSFKTVSSRILRRHILGSGHSLKKKLFRCEKCSFETNYKENLKDHIFVKHTPSEDVTEWFHCDECSLKFKLKKFLRAHVYQKHTKKKKSTR